MFINAVPVWHKYLNYEDKLNRHLIFREKMDSLKDVKLSIAAADFYRLSVNGNFVGFGPARTAKGYARVDVYDLSAFDNGAEEDNEIIIEVAGFYCKSLSTVHQESYLCAELILNGAAVKYTGRDFECFENTRRVRKVERYSGQRHFAEIRDERCGNPTSSEYRVEVSPLLLDIEFIERKVPFASCKVNDIKGYVSGGTFSVAPDGRVDSKEFGTGEKINAYSFQIEKEDNFGIFDSNEIEDKPYRYVGSLDKKKTHDAGDLPLTLSSGEWVMVDFGLIYTGFIRVSINTAEESDVIVAFSELCESDVFSFRRVNYQGVLEYKFASSSNNFEETFEPYTFRHIAIFVKNGSITLNSVGFRTFERDTDSAIKRKFKNPELNEVYEAALRTFAHNAVDLYSDCPSRERAGWLCDSYFTGRAEYFLYGETPIEDAFLENYVLFKNEGAYPEGVLPMCYPSDPHSNNAFIPQWDIWYVLEVCEYLKERRPDMDKEIFRPSVMGVLDFLERHENSDGLLENLKGWNFVEWSDANSWTRNVNYPTNFLYSGMLYEVAEVFSKPKLYAKADAIREKTTELSFNGELFVDHAIRNSDGVLINQMHISEACQYYAILYGGVDLDSPKYAKLKTYVIDDFKSFDKGEYQFCAKNAFIGLYLRMNVLLNMKDSKLMAQNVKDFCLHMCRTTGTLWEFKDGFGSLDHSFASYVALTLPFADLLSEE